MLGSFCWYLRISNFGCLNCIILHMQQQVPSKYSKLSHTWKKVFSFPLGLVWSEIRVRQAVKPSDCLYFVSICPRGSVSRHIFCRAYELPLLLHTAMAYWISFYLTFLSHLMLVSLTLLLLSFPPLRNRRSVKRIKISRNRDKTR